MCTGYWGMGWSSRAERGTQRTYWACWILTAANSTLPGSAATWPADEVKLLKQTQEKPRTCFSAFGEFQCRSSTESNSVISTKRQVFRSYMLRVWTFVTAWHPETENRHWVLKDIKESTPESRLWWLVDPQHVDYIRLKRGQALRCSLIGLRKHSFSATSAVTLTKKKREMIQIQDGAMNVF